MIKLIVTDMDGTLLNSKEELNKEFLEVFKTLKEKEILFAVASGRQKRNLELRFDKIKKDLIMLFENGSCGFLDNSELYKSELDKIIVHKLIDIGRKNSHNMLLCTEDMAYIENVNEEFITELKKYYENITFVNNLKEIQGSIIKFTIFDPKGAKENSFKIYNGLLGTRIKATISGTTWLHMTNKLASKGLGVQAIQNKFNIKPEETMVFGDSNNDLDMFKVAKFSYAMENACEEVKEAANFVAPSNDNNGVIETIKKEILASNKELQASLVHKENIDTKEIILDEATLEAKLQSIMESTASSSIVEISEPIIEEPKKAIKEEKPKKKSIKTAKKEEDTKEIPSKKIIEEEILLSEDESIEDLEEEFPEDFIEEFAEDLVEEFTEVLVEDFNEDFDDSINPLDKDDSEELDEESLEEKLLAILG